jgi:hypothetical protein
MSESTIWWLLAGAAVAVELVTGTFYLLMIAVGLAAAAIAAHLGASGPCSSLRRPSWVRPRGGHYPLHPGRGPKALPAGTNPDVNMDVGETVQVDDWQADGTALVLSAARNGLCSGDPAERLPREMPTVSGKSLAANWS